MKVLGLFFGIMAAGFIADGIAAGVFSPWWGICLAAWALIVMVDSKESC